MRNLAIFAAKFVLTFAVTLYPDLRDRSLHGISAFPASVPGISSAGDLALAGFAKQMKSGLSREPG